MYNCSCRDDGILCVFARNRIRTWRRREEYNNFRIRAWHQTRDDGKRVYTAVIKTKIESGTRRTRASFKLEYIPIYYMIPITHTYILYTLILYGRRKVGAIANNNWLVSAVQKHLLFFFFIQFFHWWHTTTKCKKKTSLPKNKTAAPAKGRHGGRVKSWSKYYNNMYIRRRMYRFHPKCFLISSSYSRRASHVYNI